MIDYQQRLFDLFAAYRPKPTYPTYPPYHVGPYLEDRFIEDFIKQDDSLSRLFIPVSWTTIYVENKIAGLQEILNSLDQDQKYFVVAQHDDFPLHNLPRDTQIFSASQHTPKNITPIPAICSPIGNRNEEKSILATFVGSLTHPIREKLRNIYFGNENFYFLSKMWSGSVSQSSLDQFIDITSRSKFALCPRGYGNTSFRLYESMQLGAVPVYISDDFCLPWNDEINWDDFCVLVNEQEIEDIEQILTSISDTKYNKMLNKIQEVYSKYFTLESLYPNIIKRIA